MSSSSTPTKAPAKAAAKKPAKKTAGSARVQALAGKLKTSPGSVTATASIPASSGEDTAAATAALLGLPSGAVTAPVPSTVSGMATSGMATSGMATSVLTQQSEPSPATATETSDALPAAGSETGIEEGSGLTRGEPDPSSEDASAEPSESVSIDVPAEPTAATSLPLALVPEPTPDVSEPAEEASPAGEGASTTETTAPARAASATAPVQPAASSRRPQGKKAASSAPSKAASTASEAEQMDRLDELVWTLSSPEHSLDQQHDRISKLTLELPIPLVDVLNRWELDQVRRTGRRLYRERLIDLALAELPSNMDKVVAMARDLPAWLKYAETEQVGSRVRAPVALELKVMKQELKLRREKGTYVRHIYAVALLDFLTSYGVPVEDPAS